MYHLSQPTLIAVMPKQKTLYNSSLHSPKNKLANSQARDAEARNEILNFCITFLRGGGESWSSLMTVMPKQKINFIASATCSLVRILCFGIPAIRDRLHSYSQDRDAEPRNQILEAEKDGLLTEEGDAEASQILCFGDTFLSVSWQTLRPVLPKQEIRFWRRRKMVFSQERNAEARN